MNRICRAAMIGAGMMAKEHLKAFPDINNVKFVGIMSRTRAKAEKLASEFDIPAVADNIEELAALKPDLAVITVSADQVHEVVKEACRHPWTILAEKPVGLNLAESAETLELAESLGARVYVALNRRFYETSRKLKERLEQLDGPRFIEVFDQQEPAKLRRLRGHADETGLMFGNSIHTIDYFSWLGRGEIVSVENSLPWNDSVPLAVCATIKFSSGDLGVYHGLWNAPGPWAVNVTTPQERWELRPLEKARFQKAETRALEEVQLGDIDVKFKPGLRVQAQNAVNHALGLPGDCPTLADAYKTMRLIDAIYRH